MDYLIEIDEIIEYGRPLGKFDGKKLRAYIEEVEDVYIKKNIGNELYLKLKKDKENDDYKKLLNGGEYTNRNGETCSFLGLKKAISYYVYAQVIMSGDVESTKTGIRLKDSDFSSRISSKERSDYYSNALEVANNYLKDCILFCKEKNLITFKSKNFVSNGSIIIKKIGR